MLLPIVQITVFILSQSKLSNQVQFLQRNIQVENPEIHTLCHPDSKLTFLDCCLQPWVQKSYVYCRRFGVHSNGVKSTFDPTNICDISLFQREDFLLDSGEESGDIGLQPMSTYYVSSATDPISQASDDVHDWIKRSTFTRATLLPQVKQERSFMPIDKMSKLRSFLSKRNIIQEIDQVKEFQPLHKQFSTTHDMSSYVGELVDEPTSVVENEEMKSVNADSKSAPIVINSQLYLGSKEYTARRINDSERRRKFMAKLHNFIKVIKDKNKLEVQRGCEKSSGREDIKAADDQQIKTADVKDTKTSACIENKSREYFNPRRQELVRADVESMNSKDDRRELQFNAVLVADDPVSVRVQSVGSGETLVKRWGSLGAGKFRRWWFGN